MTKREFCELMAAGHEEAADNLARVARAESSRAKDHLFAIAAGQQALARAFHDLAKEQPND